MLCISVCFIKAAWGRILNKSHFQMDGETFEVQKLQTFAILQARTLFLIANHSDITLRWLVFIFSILKKKKKMGLIIAQRRQLQPTAADVITRIHHLILIILIKRKATWETVKLQSS